MQRTTRASVAWVGVAAVIAGASACGSSDTPLGAGGAADTSASSAGVTGPSSSSSGATTHTASSATTTGMTVSTSVTATAAGTGGGGTGGMSGAGGAGQGGGGLGGMSGAGGSGGALAQSSSAGSGGAGGGTVSPCTLPGSVQFTSAGVVVVPGNGGTWDPSFLHLPVGFCAHYFANVGNARQLRVAPGGELFVASPTTLTTGGGAGGLAAIVVLPDDDHDGLADAPVTFLQGIASTQGIAFGPGAFYYQNGTKIMSVPYQAGDRAPRAAGTQLVDYTAYSSGLHWPKPIDVADDGAVYFGNGGDQGEACIEPHPFHGGILQVGPGAMSSTQIARGLRNPIALRCARGHDHCFALELAKDYTGSAGGREKMVLVRPGDDWGFPCCASKNTPYADVQPPPLSCSQVAPEDVSFLIGDTPFALAFAPASWPAPYAGSAVVATHGAAGSWTGARMVAIAMDPATGLPVPASDASGTDTGAMTDFATGWDDGTRSHGRPAALDFSADGRLFVANDTSGLIFWIAPM